MSELVAERIRSHAERLALAHLAETAESLVARAEEARMGYFEFLDAVLEEEVETPGGTLRMSEASWLPTAFAASLRDYVNRYRASGWP